MHRVDYRPTRRKPQKRDVRIPDHKRPRIVTVCRTPAIISRCQTCCALARSFCASSLSSGRSVRPTKLDTKPVLSGPRHERPRPAGYR